MKFTSLVLILIIIFISDSFGQTKYIITSDGVILDTIAYFKMKSEQVNKMKSILQSDQSKITIIDNFKLVKQTNDSMIYSYKWDIKIGGYDEKVAKSFDPYDFIDKEFQLPALKTLNNREINLSNLKGKPTLINFWFTNCKPCIEEMPVLNNIKLQMKDSVNFIAITFEKVEKVKAFLKVHKFEFTQIPNAEKFIDSMNMESFPVNIFLDKNGVVKKIENGIPYIRDEKKNLKMGNGDEFLNFLRELL